MQPILSDHTARQHTIAVNAFASEMIGFSAEAQQEATRAVDLRDADLVALAMFGKAVTLAPLTKRFSLLR